MKDQKIVKITFEYEDYSLVYKNEDAKELQKAIDGMTMFCHVHGNNPFETLKLNPTKILNDGFCSP